MTTVRWCKEKIRGFSFLKTSEEKMLGARDTFKRLGLKETEKVQDELEIYTGVIGCLRFLRKALKIECGMNGVQQKTRPWEPSTLGWYFV